MFSEITNLTLIYKCRNADGLIYTAQGVFGDHFILCLAQYQPDGRRIVGVFQHVRFQFVPQPVAQMSR